MVKKWNKCIVNGQKCSSGLWTRQRKDSHSILDLMIIDDFLLPLLKGLVIDDLGEFKTIKTDHFLLVGVLKADYNRLNWAPSSFSSWSVPKTDVSLFKETIESILEPATSQTMFSVEDIYNKIDEALQQSLKVSSKKLLPSSGIKDIPAAVLEFDNRIRAVNSELHRLHNKIHIVSQRANTIDKISSLEDKLVSLF